MHIHRSDVQNQFMHLSDTETKQVMCLFTTVASLKVALVINAITRLTRIIRVVPLHFNHKCPSILRPNSIYHHVLALLDYVSRAHEIEICPSAVVHVAIISEPIEQIPFKFQLWLPLGHTLRHFMNFWKNNAFFEGYFFRFRYHRILCVLWEPQGQNAIPPQITFESFQTFSKFSSQLSSIKYCFGVLKLWVFDCSRVFSINMGPYGSQHFKTLLLPQNTFEVFQT